MRSLIAAVICAPPTSRAAPLILAAPRLQTAGGIWNRHLEMGLHGGEPVTARTNPDERPSPR